MPESIGVAMFTIRWKSSAIYRSPDAVELAVSRLMSLVSRPRLPFAVSLPELCYNALSRTFTGEWAERPALLLCQYSVVRTVGIPDRRLK